MPLEINLAGRRALVTGVSSGIGAAIAAKLAEAGCDVAGCGSRPADDSGARSFEEAVKAHGRMAHYFSVNLATETGPAKFVEFAAQKLGGIEIVVSNAGRNIFKGAEKCTEADWAECMNLDLASHWRLARAAKPWLEASSATGVILVIGSNHAWNTIPGCFPYNIAKAGLLGLVQSLAIEWGERIRSVGIAPGFIDTAGNDTWFNSFPDPKAERTRTEKLHPVGRIGSVDEIGVLCVFLASDHAGFISGTTILADGGRSALMQDS
jgi:NAD(P)-dependent dehydrogenase (short-subunit alcohol dehydrogenase family)